MKKIFSVAFLAMLSMGYAQIIIGNEIGTASNKTSVLLEFATGIGQNKGIILPYVRVLPASPAEGMIILDSRVSTAARVRFYNGSTWVDMSGQDGNVTAALATQPAVSEVSELPETKAIIGSRTSTADGVLVLESTTKAMVLPTVDNVQNIASPSPGMMVYVNKAGAKRLAVFNGTVWSYWKAGNE